MNTTILITNLLIGPLLLVISIVFKAFPPKERNWVYGYRTSRSQKSQEAWDAANKYANDLMLWVAIATIVFQVIFYFIFSTANALLASCLLMCALLLGLVILVENHLKTHFDGEGKRLSR